MNESFSRTVRRRIADGAGLLRPGANATRVSALGAARRSSRAGECPGSGSRHARAQPVPGLIVWGCRHTASAPGPVARARGVPHRLVASRRAERAAGERDCGPVARACAPAPEASRGHGEEGRRSSSPRSRAPGRRAPGRPGARAGSARRGPAGGHSDPCRIERSRARTRGRPLCCARDSRAAGAGHVRGFRECAGSPGAGVARPAESQGWDWRGAGALRQPGVARRTTGRVADRRATSRKPARSNAERIPVQANGGGIASDRGSTG